LKFESQRSFVDEGSWRELVPGCW